MGWRDRVKKSFGDFEDIGEGIQNLKNPEKKEKRGSKVFFKHYPQNPQNPQNRKDEGGDPKPDTPRAVKNQSTPNPTPAATPAPEPPGMGPEYEALWNRAWELAEWIDNPTRAPLAERWAKLPELDELVERMRVIEDKLQSVSNTVRLNQLNQQTKPDHNAPGDPGQCPACGQSAWWRKGPNSKWICGRCHPPVHGAAVLYSETPGGAQPLKPLKTGNPRSPYAQN